MSNATETNGLAADGRRIFDVTITARFEGETTTETVATAGRDADAAIAAAREIYEAAGFEIVDGETITLREMGVSRKKLAARLRGDLRRNESNMTDADAEYRREALALLNARRPLTEAEAHVVADCIPTSLDEWHLGMTTDAPAPVLAGAEKRLASARRAGRLIAAHFSN